MSQVPFAQTPMYAGAPALRGSMPAPNLDASGGLATTGGVQQAQAQIDPPQQVPGQQPPAPAALPPGSGAAPAQQAPPPPQPAPLPPIGNPGSGWIGNPLAPDGEGPVTSQVPKLAESVLEEQETLLSGAPDSEGILSRPDALAGCLGVGMAQIKASVLAQEYITTPLAAVKVEPEKPVKTGSSGCSCGGKCVPCAQRKLANRGKPDEKISKSAGVPAKGEHCAHCHAHFEKSDDGYCNSCGRDYDTGRVPDKGLYHEGKYAQLLKLSDVGPPPDVQPHPGVGGGLKFPPDLLATLVKHLWPVAAGGVGGAAYGAYKAPGGSPLRGALIGGVGGAAGGAAFSGGNALLHSDQGESLNGTTVGNTALLGATGLGLHGGLSLGRHMADKMDLGREDNKSENDLREIDVMDKRHGLLSDLFGKRSVAEPIELTPFAQAFRDKCVAQGYDELQIKQAAMQAIAKVNHPEVTAALAPLVKSAGGLGGLGTFFRGLTPNLVRGAAKAAPAAASAAAPAAATVAKGLPGMTGAMGGAAAQAAPAVAQAAAPGLLKSVGTSVGQGALNLGKSVGGGLAGGAIGTTVDDTANAMGIDTHGAGKLIGGTAGMMGGHKLQGKALLGLGGAGLSMGSVNVRAHHAQEQARQAAQDVKDYVHNTGQTVMDHTNNTADQVRQYVDNTAQQSLAAGQGQIQQALEQAKQQFGIQGQLQPYLHGIQQRWGRLTPDAQRAILMGGGGAVLGGLMGGRQGMGVGAALGGAGGYFGPRIMGATSGAYGGGDRNIVPKDEPLVEAPPEQAGAVYQGPTAF